MRRFWSPLLVLALIGAADAAHAANAYQTT